MLTISQAVEKVVMTKPFVIEALTEGLLNISSLARQIRPTIERMTGKQVKQGAIVMALNRLMPNFTGNVALSFGDMLGTLGDIIVRSNLTDYTFRNSASIFECHIKLMQEISDCHDVFYTMVRGVFESNLVVGSDLGSVVERHFAGEEWTFKNENLAAITL